MSRPNVLLVLIDDMGFGAPSAYGGPCEMPTAERLAAGGLTYSRFHVTAMCSPTRQALLTGRNHHSVNMGAVSNFATTQEGYTSVRPASAAPIARLLRGAGYATGAFGKMHQTPMWEVSPAGPFARWPTGEGFDAFYGFMDGEMDHWSPLLYDGTTPVTPPPGPDGGYHLTEDLVDRTAAWVRTLHSLTPERPWFAYLSFGATHAPFHVLPEWMEKYEGRFDGGWDVQREITLERQKRLGLVPADAELAPWVGGVPHWDELSEAERRVAARLMEAYAAFAEHTDVQLGRLVDDLQEMGVLDDTLVFYVLGDNGASGEGGLSGTLNTQQSYNGLFPSTDAMLERLGEIGGPTTFPLYPVGWALAMNTPYQWTKQVASHYGGTRNGMLVHWPAGIEARGEIRDQWHHVIDVVPTILDAAGIEEPHAVDGVPQQPIEGTSMAYTFDDAAAPDRRRTQYFELMGNRAIYHEGWTAVTKHRTPWDMGASKELVAFADDVWELYDTTADWTQATDLAAERPEKLRELQDLFELEAGRHQVLPLDDRSMERMNASVAGRPDLFGDRDELVLGPGASRLHEDTVPNLKNRSHRVHVLAEVGGDPAEGILVSQGGRFGGWALGCVDGRPTYVYNFLGLELTAASAAGTLSPGEHEIVVEITHSGSIGGPASVELSVDGEAQADAEIELTVPYTTSTHETLDVGTDLGTPVCDGLRGSFTGAIRSVRIAVAPAALDNRVAAEALARRRYAGQ